MDNMIKEIGLLQEYDQIKIRNDIEKRIIPQALDVLRETPCEFERYIEQEIESAKNAKIKMIESFYLPGAIHYKISKIYVYNDERLKALNELREQVEEKEPKTIPNELNNDNTKMILQRAIDEGLCDDNYKWEKTNRLLAYFVDKACEYLEISIGQYDGREKVKWKPFEKLFGIDNLAQAKKDYQREGQIPKGSEIVDRIFNSN